MDLYSMVCFLVVSVSAGSPVGTNVSAVQRLRHLETQLFEHILQEYPEHATTIGKSNFDDILNSYSLESFKRRKLDNEKFLQSLEQIDHSHLTKSQKIDYNILREHILTFLDGYKWKEFGNLNPINFLEGPIKHPKWLKAEPNFTNFHRHVDRIKHFPLQIKQQITLMKRAIQLNRTNHMHSMHGVVKLIRNQQNRYFTEPFSQLGMDFWNNLTKDWDVLLKYLSKAYSELNKLVKFIDKVYLSKTRAKEGVSSFLGGAEYYEACLRYHLGINITAEQVHEMGIKEVKRIFRQMNTIMENLGFNGTLHEFFKYLRKHPEFYNHTRSQLIEEYQDIVHRQIEPKLWGIFKNISLDPIRVVPMPYPTGFWGVYHNNTFFVSVDQPHLRSSFTMMPLSLHESNPGHHFQENYFDKNNLPEYRRWLLYGRRFAVPFNYPTYTSYIEGWALYSEFLGEELGLYNNSYDLFGRYCSEILRACRLVVDTGIHAFRWSKAEAVAYIANYTDFPISQISKEVDRYITWPGHSCAYKIGEMKIKELRTKAQKKLGNTFDVKEFHHRILKSGPVTLNVLEEIINEWIQDCLAADSVSLIHFQSSALPMQMYHKFLLLVLLLQYAVTLCCLT